MAGGHVDPHLVRADDALLDALGRGINAGGTLADILVGLLAAELRDDIDGVPMPECVW